MPPSLSKAKRDMLVLVAGNAVQYLTAIVSIKLMTTILSPSEMGRVSIITAIALWFNVLYNGVGAYVQRNLLAWAGAGTALDYIKKFSSYLLLVSFAGTALLLILRGTVGVGVEISPEWLVALLIGLTFFAYLNTGIVGWLNLFGLRGWFVLFSTGVIWAGLIFSCALAYFRGNTAESWLLGQVLGQIAVLSFSSIILVKLLKKSPGADLRGQAAAAAPFPLKTIFTFAWPMSVASLLLWMQQSAYRFILEGITSMEVVGLVTVGFGLGLNFINRFEILFNQFYHPVFYKEISSDDPARKAEAWNAYAYYLLPPALLFSVYIVTGAPFLARIFVGDQFYEVAKTMIAWGVISQLVLVMMTVYSMAGIIQQKTTDFILPNVAGVLVMAVALLLLAGWNPYTGSGIALTGGALASLLVMRLKMKKLMPVHFPVGRSFFAGALSLPIGLALGLYAALRPVPGFGESVLALAITGIYAFLAGVMLVGRRVELHKRLQFLRPLEGKLEALLPRNSKWTL